MSIPLNKQLRLPILKAMEDGKERHRTEIFDYLDKEFQFSEEDKKQRSPGGSHRLYERKGWALANLKHAQKGIFITTASYSKSAIEYVEKVPQKVILIDGADLVDFMIENNVGVSKDFTFEIKKIDLDYFE